VRSLGLVWRVALVVVAALIALQIVVATVFYEARSRATQTGARLPLPDQVAALATLLDGASPEEQTLLLRAVNGLGLSAVVQHNRPDGIDAGRRLELVESALRTYLDAPADRLVSARLLDGPRPTQGWFLRVRQALDRRAQIVVALKSGDYLVVESADQLVSRLMGLPMGFWAGIIGFLVAAIAIIAVIRETRPLSLLAGSVARFGTDLEPAPLRERGSREVRALTRAINQMQSRISTLIKSRSFIIGAIAHDLRTYLTRFALRIDGLPDGETRDRAARDIEDMKALLEDALSFARTTFAGGETEPIDLTKVVAHECEERAAAGAPVTMTLPSAPVIVSGSGTALARMIGNLVDNAVKYGHEAEVTLLSEAKEGQILVEDRGPGIPVADRESIFDPFRRLEPSRNREHGGAGLGLAIARQVIEGHGGSVAVEDRPGGGSRFRVRLPRAS